MICAICQAEHSAFEPCVGFAEACRPDEKSPAPGAPAEDAARAESVADEGAPQSTDLFPWAPPTPMPVAAPAENSSPRALEAAEPAAEVRAPPTPRPEAPAPRQTLAPSSPSGPGGAPIEEDLVGRTIGNFRIVRMLGRGGMGTVYLGEHAAIGSKVAVKFLHAHLATDATLVERFFAEARAANLIGHENIVNIFDLNLLPPNRYYLVMEYLDGQPLSSMLAEPLAPSVSVPILMQVCDALQAAHAAGVVHRDLKPENVFLVRRGSTEHFVKIVDFGIAKLGGNAPGVTMAGLVVGTPEYMSPEQWQGDAIDGRADLYALGLIAYLVSTGRLPFRETTALAYYVAHLEKPPQPPRELNPSLPESFEQVILKALAKRREDRFQTALEFRAALERVLSPAPRNATPIPRAPTPRPAAPQSAHPRHVASLPARVTWPGLAEPREATSGDLSRGGVYLCAGEPLPPLFSRVRVTLVHPEGELECDGDIVRHVSPDQAKAWGMSPGFAVQFVASTPEFRRAVDRIVQGKPLSETPSATSLGDDPLAEQVLDFYRKRIAGDHYALLGAAPDAECSEVRHRARQASEELEALKGARSLSLHQRQQVQAALERLHAAMQVLGTPARRAEHDANRGNFRGVARCLAAGLPLRDLEGLRKDFLAAHPKAETNARMHLVSGNAYLASGDLSRAVAAFESALTLDPLSLEAHTRYWTLKRRLVQDERTHGGKP